MPKVDPLTDTVLKDYSVFKLDENFKNIEKAFENTISRDGSTPNDMRADLDMGGNSIINASVIFADDIKIEGSSVADSVKTSEANAAAAAAEAEASAAAALSHLNDFQGVYYGSLSSPPTSDPLGNPPNAGDLYYDTTDNSLKIWNGSSWVAYSPFVSHTHPWSDITSKPTTLSGYGITDAVPSSRLVQTGAGLTGGGDLSVDRTIAAQTLSQTDWNAGTSTTEAVISPAKLAGVVSTLGGTGYKTIEIFTSSTTWTTPAGVTEVWAIVVGGGGGGSNYTGSNGHAGGYGGLGYGRVSVSGTMAVIVGSGGSGGNPASGGGYSSFGTITATGGGGASSTSNGATGSATGGLKSQNAIHFPESIRGFLSAYTGVFTDLLAVTAISVSYYIVNRGSSSSPLVFDPFTYNYTPGARGSGGISGYAAGTGGVGGCVVIMY